ncbi:MAG: phosphoglycolate phosphatase [Pseudomonadota bacterium]
MTQSPSPTRLCVLDLDGTLADTAPDLVAALNKLLAEEGLPEANFDEARAFVGLGARVLIERAHRAQGIDLADADAIALTERYVAHYALDIAGQTQLFAHVGDALDAMRKDGWRLAICTNKREALARQLLETMNIADWFDAICGGDTFAERKPNGQHILKTIAAAGGDPRHSVMIGDSPPDILGAQNAKVPVIAVSFGYSNEPIKPLGPDVIIDSFADLQAQAERLVGTNDS